MYCTQNRTQKQRGQRPHVRNDDGVGDQEAEEHAARHARPLAVALAGLPAARLAALAAAAQAADHDARRHHTDRVDEREEHDDHQTRIRLDRLRTQTHVQTLARDSDGTLSLKLIEP